MLRIAIYAEDAGGNDDGEIIGLKLDKYYNASTLNSHGRMYRNSILLQVIQLSGFVPSTVNTDCLV